MGNILVIGLGGFVGSIARYLVGGWVQALFKESAFPYGTLCVNLTGCLLIGLIGAWMENADLLRSTARSFLLVGLLGGFTTFSAFGYETMALFREGQSFGALCNVGLQIVVGLVAVWLGYSAASLL